MVIVLKIRKATPDDSGQISKLLCELTAKFIAKEFSAYGRQLLLDAMKPDVIAKNIQSGYRYHIAEIDGQLVGVVAVRDNSHLFHFFVAEQYQRQGIAKQLWNTAMRVCDEEGNPGEYTVNSSRYALDVYKALGFVTDAAVQQKNGVVYYPMKLSLIQSA
jgi:GNAT superfamily N-acetyltransferase